MDRDPYVVLGLAPDSEPGEWKRAYRRLAMRWHPDRNDHPEATERFKEISAAYERLIAVDAPETEENEAAPEASPASPENETPRAADIRLNLELGLEEAAAGCRKTVHYTRGKACRTCDGSGEAGLSRTRFCEACHGSGRIRDAARVLVPCDACGGRGFFSERICPDCTGSGRETTAHSLEINVPPGMLPGDELRLGGQGEAGDSERAAGDLYLTVVLASHPLFRLDGRDLHYRMPVDGLALIVGSEIELAVPGGRVKHRLAPGKPELRERATRVAAKRRPATSSCNSNQCFPSNGATASASSWSRPAPTCWPMSRTACPPWPSGGGLLRVRRGLPSRLAIPAIRAS